MPACMPDCLSTCLPPCMPVPACMLACLPAYLPPCQPASECTSFRTSVCPSDRPSVRPPSVRHTARSAVRPTARSAVRRAPSQLHSNDTFELMLGLNSSNTVHIERNIQVGGHALALKNRKKPFQQSIEKKEAKKKAIMPVSGEGRRQSGSPGNPKIPFRKALAKSGEQI